MRRQEVSAVGVVNARACCASLSLKRVWRRRATGRARRGGVTAWTWIETLEALNSKGETSVDGNNASWKLHDNISAGKCFLDEAGVLRAEVAIAEYKGLQAAAARGGAGAARGAK